MIVLLVILALSLGGDQVPLMPYRSALVRAASARQAPFVPMPPVVNFVHGLPPGMTPEDNFTAGAGSDTIYYTDPLDKFSRAHEIGHLLDRQVLTDADRTNFQRLMRAPGGAWVQPPAPQGSIAGRRSADEWFADYFAAAATNLDLKHSGVSAYAQFGPKRLERFEAALTQLGRRLGLKPYR